MDSYWDLYVAYINHCVRYNYENDIDPHHYRMEWNHFLPQCKFGDQPVGQYLLLRQHAIASALQTIAFQDRCMCGWHIKYIPELLWKKAKPFYSRKGFIQSKLEVACHSPENRRLGGRRTFELGVGAFNPENKIKAVKRVREVLGKTVLVQELDETQKEFPSIRMAAAYYSLTPLLIRTCLKEKRPILKGKGKGLKFELSE